MLKETNELQVLIASGIRNTESHQSHREIVLGEVGCRHLCSFRSALLPTESVQTSGNGINMVLMIAS